MHISLKRIRKSQRPAGERIRYHGNHALLPLGGRGGGGMGGLREALHGHPPGSRLGPSLIMDPVHDRSLPARFQRSFANWIIAASRPEDTPIWGLPSHPWLRYVEAIALMGVVSL